MIAYLLSLSLLIAVVLLIRAVFRKTVSPRVTYALWLLVVIRMMAPVTLFEVDVTLPEYLQTLQTEPSEEKELPTGDPETSADVQEKFPPAFPVQPAPTYPSQNTTPVTPAYPPSEPDLPTVPEQIMPAAPIVPETEAEPIIPPVEQTPEVPDEPAVIHWQRIANLVWFIGAAVIAVWVLFTSITYNRRLVKNRILHRTVRGTKVYISEDASVPCISGLIPSIYITPEAANSKSEMLIIIHEHVHLRHGDHIWAFIRALALIVFWYNPLVWAAATVSKLDAELACDDAISVKLNDDERLAYAHILLDTIPQKRRYATGLGSAPMKERILMLTKRQKNRGICLILALVLAVSAVGCSFVSVNGKTEETDNSANEEELPEESVSETDADNTAETEIPEETVPTGETEVPENSDSIAIPEIVLTQVDKMPYPRQIARHCVSATGSNAVVWMLDDSPEFCIERYSPENKETDYFTGTLTLPDGYENPAVFRIAGGGGSGEIDITVKAEQNGETVYLNYFFNFTNEDFLPDSVTSMNELQLKHLLESVSGGAYKGEQLSDYRNNNPGDSLFYEGYTVEYNIPHPYYAGETFDFHLHLPQLGDSSAEAEEWNRRIAETCSAQFGDYLRETAYGNNKDFYANVTWETVTTGDVVTIYILKASGIMNSGAAGLSYDIYHYDTVGKKFLSTDEFLAYYAEGQFADYTIADIVKFMNEHTFTTDEGGSPYPLTEENILGVIPSVFGDGKFDVVYQGFSIEGRFATRMLFSPYPTHTSDAVYTYRLTYHDYVDCEDKEIYGDPMGYRLLISQRVAGEYDAGYYVDCLFIEDIAERPESYSQSVYGEYYTPIQQDAYGDMYMVIDHETDWGHLNAWIPFDMPDTAQDYYWGIHNKYFSYDRILNGTNYQVNQNIAEQVGQVLDAYRNGKDPNELFPASKTEYTSYPLEMIRENPTAEEIGEILKNTSVGESGIINFSIDLGDSWSMALPMDIAGFGDGVQAYFTGVYYAHGTPMEEEDIEWTQYSETRTGEDGNIYQISFVLPVEWMHGSGGILNDANGKKRIGSRYIAVNRSKEDFVSSLEEMAEQYHVDLDSPLTGTSDSGISYMGYCFEGECEIPGDITGRYLYRFAYSDSISLQMDVWKRNAYDDDSFYEQYVLPIIQSVTIRELSTETIFASILENKQTFCNASSKESVLLSEYKAETDYSVKKYTILDLNDDRDPEMVLWLGHGTDDYAGFLVLHRDGNTVYAHGFPYRGFNGLNGDGVYTSSSSAFNISILKLDFNGDTCTETVLARREGDGSPESVTYYIEDRIGTAEEFEKCLSRYNSRGIPDWYSYDIEEITDIDDWHTLLWAEGLPDDENRQPSQNVFSFIRDLVKGESDIPEINGLGIKDYSIELLKDSAYDSLFRFTFTVTGNSLPQTLLPGTYTWMLLDGMELSICTEGVPATQEEAETYWKRMRGLDRFEGNSAVEAVNTYLSWMPYIYEVSPYGKWDPENVHLPYNYICAHYGNENLEISFDKLQSLMTEKFGITVDRPNENRLLSRCEYNKETDTVRYADTRGYSAVHRILDIREEDGITYVIVQLFADRHRMIPSHKLQFAIGEGEVFLGSKIIQNGNYDPREIS